MGWLIFGVFVAACALGAFIWVAVTNRRDRRERAKQEAHLADLDDFLESLQVAQVWLPYSEVVENGRVTVVGMALVNTGDERRIYERKPLERVTARPFDDYADRVAASTHDAMLRCYDLNTAPAQ